VCNVTKLTGTTYSLLVYLDGLYYIPFNSRSSSDHMHRQILKRVLPDRGGRHFIMQSTVLKSDILNRIIPQSEGFSRRRTCCHTKSDPQIGHGVLKATGFILGPLSKFAEMEVPGSVLASHFSLTTSLEKMPSPPEKGRQARLSVEQKKNKLSDMWVI
jgi:hypothetical protein